MPSPRLVVVSFALAVAFALLPTLVPTAALAAPVAGKWGLGVDTGELLGSSAEGTILLGRSDRTAWLLFVSVSGARNEVDQEYDFAAPDTFFTARDEVSGYSVTVGPGLRRYVRQSGRVSAYLDGFTRFGRSRNTSDRSSGTLREEIERASWSAGGGFALGVEYFFERWPVSLAAHTSFLNLTYRWNEEEFSREDGDAAKRSSESLDVSGGVGPRVQVRVYF
ncbi:MAG TPA: hypothetical protein VFT32_07795 [Candidatus Eisenbacteria bacterium]|nr:hypothetical protein [Candidatus Eisenbacteria bacterium]